MASAKKKNKVAKSGGYNYLDPYDIVSEEDKADIEEVKRIKALKEKPIPWEEVKEKLGL